MLCFVLFAALKSDERTSSIDVAFPRCDTLLMAYSEIVLDVSRVLFFESEGEQENEDW